MGSDSDEAGEAGSADDRLREAQAQIAVLTKRLAKMTAHADNHFRELKKLARQVAAPTDPLEGLPGPLRARAEALALSATSQALARARAVAGRGRGPAAPAGDRGWPGLAASGPPDPLWKDAGPLRVVLAGAGSSVLDLLEDPRLCVSRLSGQAIADPDILVATRAELADFESLAAEVPRSVWESVARGATKLVLDASREGYPHQASVSERLHRFLAGVQARPREVLYLTQDRGYAQEYEQFCRSSGAEGVEVVVWDYFPNKLIKEHLAHGHREFRARLADYLLRPPLRPHLFLSLNYVPRPTKTLFLLRLIKEGLWDRGLVSFGSGHTDPAEALTARKIGREMISRPGFEDLAEELLPCLDALLGAEPRFFTTKDADPKLFRTHLMSDLPLREYASCWFSVVAETEMSPRVHRITEKPFKPLLNLHPMILLGSPGSLGLLRSYGFRTFEAFFDESYDDEADPRRRFEMVYGQVVRMSRMEQDELRRLEAGISEILVFNAYWGLAELPRLFKDTVEADLVDRLVRLARR